MKPNDTADLLAFQMRVAGLPEPVREFQFHPTRRWRFDLAYPKRMLAIECEGGTWMRGRHNFGHGYENDMRKYNSGALLGWCILRYSTGMIKSGEALDELSRILK